MTFAVLRAAALAIVVTGVATAVQAQSSAPAIGYVQTAGGSISVSFNSAGRTNSVSELATGAYDVSLPGLGRNSDPTTFQDNVQVNGVATTAGPGNYCVSGHWNSSGPNAEVGVNCFYASGQPVATDFSIFYQQRTSPPPGGAIAFMDTFESPRSAGTAGRSVCGGSGCGGHRALPRDWCKADY